METHLLANEIAKGASHKGCGMKDRVLNKTLYIFAIGSQNIVRSMFCAVSLSIICGAVKAEEKPLASPAIDQSLFREGAIEERKEEFQYWHINCQEIVKIKRRVCNITSKIFNDDGKAVGSVLAATDDKGTPTLLIAVNGNTKDSPITVETNYKSVRTGKKASIANFKKKFRPVRCDPVCKFMFPFDNKLVYSLNEGNEIKVRINNDDKNGDFSSRNKKLLPENLTIRGEGFSSALSASTNPW